MNYFGTENGSKDGSSMRSTIVLSRTSGEKWGFSWDKYKFFAMEQRIVEKLVPGSKAARWNEQMEATGRPDRCVIPGDRLISANGRTGTRDIAKALEGDDVVIEFERLFSRAIPVREPSQNAAA